MWVGTLFTLFIIFFSACSSTQTPYHKVLNNHKKNTTYILHTHNTITKKLYNTYKRWKGVNYSYAGEDLKGVDCSALVQQIYKEAFHIYLPRTTKDQIKVGIPIQKKDLKEGDLLFFQIDSKGLHVGIFLEKGNFIHASSKHGVSLSNIQKTYWRDRFYKAKRLLL